MEFSLSANQGRNVGEDRSVTQCQLVLGLLHPRRHAAPCDKNLLIQRRRTAMPSSGAAWGITVKHGFHPTQRVQHTQRNERSRRKGRNDRFHPCVLAATSAAFVACAFSYVRSAFHVLVHSIVLCVCAYTLGALRWMETRLKRCAVLCCRVVSVM